MGSWKPDHPSQYEIDPVKKFKLLFKLWKNEETVYIIALQCGFSFDI